MAILGGAAGWHALLPQLSDERLVSFVRSQRLAPTTMHRYRHLWSTFVSFCSSASLPPLPASPATVRAFLLCGIRSGVAPSSLDTALCAITCAHEIHDYRPPVRADHKQLVEGHRALVRALHTEPHDDAHAQLPFSFPRSVVDRLSSHRNRRTWFHALRDAAVITLGIAAMLRPSELARLRVADATVNTGLRPPSVLVRLARFKTDRSGNATFVRTLGIDHELEERSHAHVLATWLDLRATLVREAEDFAYLFFSYRCRVKRPMSTASIAKAVKRTAVQCGVSARKVSGHSLRITGAAMHLDAGIPIDQILVAGRWSLTSTAFRRYVAQYGRDSSWTVRR